MKLDSTKRQSQVKPVGAAKLTIEIMRALARHRGAIGVTPLARQLERYPGTVYSILKTLEAEGIVAFNRQSKTYKLSHGGMLELTGWRSGEELPQRISPLLLELSTEFGVCLYLSQKVREDAMVIVATAEPDKPLGLYARVGHRFPTALGGTGRLLLGWEGADDAVLKAAYDKWRWPGDKPDFHSWAACIRQDSIAGFSYEEDSVPEGLASLAVPVATPGAEIKYILNAIGPRGEIAGKNLPALVSGMKDLAARSLILI
ncbi:IclR family transcriptional regulator [Sneathiella chinensis]|uniref:IclR family transcriptional regulator n=1 Tax=Sneathiella chinensis TaxID=349750 RepID=A0ABQ5U1K1_9PROT|nr:helix-turn-helix domain-containing protein [Sneathiella chinensis]GLQ05555.1 hypothetical protein GCM10007924_07760 [Sneathiella chinensis]